MTFDQIINTITNHLNKSGESINCWHIGITSNVVAHIENFNDLPKEHDWFKAFAADNGQIAQQVIKYFRDQGANIQPIAHDETLANVYAYVEMKTTSR